MADLSFNYYDQRAIMARGGSVIKAHWLFLLPILLVLLAVAGIVLLVLGLGVGWVVLGLTSLPFMALRLYKDYLHELPPGKEDNIESKLEGDILGLLPKKPTSLDIAKAAGSVVSGQFMGARLGLTANLLQQLASVETDNTAKIWSLADSIRESNGMDQINGAVLAAAFVRNFPNYEGIIAQIHLDDADIDEGIRWHRDLKKLIKDVKRPKRTGGVARDWSFGFTPMLDRFGQNISEQISRSGYTLGANVAAHQESIDKLIDTFASGGKQNAALVGKPGVGKTTIIHGFAAKLLDAKEKLPDSMRFRQVFILDSSALISAAPERGKLEDLIMRVLGEAYSAKNMIICLDDAQLFFQEGIGSVDLSNVLQPILDAGRLRVILSMDEQKYLEINKRSPQLTNTLNRINIAPASEAETMMVMRDQLIATEIRRNVTYTLQAVKEAYRLSERYLHDQAQPGKAVRLLESAAAYNESGLVTINSVQQAIEQTMDVKVSVASSTDDRDKLLRLEELIHKRMVNQTRAVGVVSDALRRARAGVRNQGRPIGTFLFMGPTGVGKTELSKALAEVYFGGEERLIRIDLNQYVKASDVKRLISDGVKDSMSLTAQAMKQPFSVVLLDEIEKAAPEVQSTLLQMLDEGILRDEVNREVSFRDAIIIATSNAGAERIREYIDRGYRIEQFEQEFLDELINSQQFRPEFLNRFDEIVIFRPFKKEEIAQVFDIILKGVNKTLANQKVTVTVAPDAKEFLIDRGYDPRLGARPMRRVVQKAVENIVAKQVLGGSVGAGDAVEISLDQVQDVFASEIEADEIRNT